MGYCGPFTSTHSSFKHLVGGTNVLFKKCNYQNNLTCKKKNELLLRVCGHLFLNEQ